MMVRRTGRTLPQRCLGCGQLTEKWVLHHIVPVQNGGQNIPSNLAILCHPCHQAAHKLTHLDEEQRRREFNLETAEATAIKLMETKNVEEAMVKKLMETKNIDDIIKGISQFHGLSVDIVRGRRRKKRLVCARAHIAHALREQSDLSLKEIGRLLGGRDHSTILNYLETRNPDGSEKT